MKGLELQGNTFTWYLGLDRDCLFARKDELLKTLGETFANTAKLQKTASIGSLCIHHLEDVVVKLKAS